MTAAEFARTGFKIRCRLAPARGPLEADTLGAAAEAAVRLARAGRVWR